MNFGEKYRPLGGRKELVRKFIFDVKDGDWRTGALKEMGVRAKKIKGRRKDLINTKGMVAMTWVGVLWPAAAVSEPLRGSHS